MLNQYTPFDLLVFACYAILLLVSGYWFNRRATTSNDYFLGGNTMPVWMVSISVLATSQSAATFLGGPDQGYRGDLSYLSTNIGALIAAILVSYVLIPRFFQAKVFTVYELLQQRFGETAKQQAGLIYLFGRLLASGARLYMAGLAVAMILFGDIAAASVVISTALIAVIGVVYTVYGGIRSVIYSDVIQCFVYVSAALAVLIWLYMTIPAPLSDIYTALALPIDGNASKLALLKWEMDFSSAGVFNMGSIFTGFVLLNIAAFGLDQDMTQRVLTCKNAKQASIAMISSVIMVIPVMLLFILIGLLLYVYYQRPDLMLTSNATETVPSFAGETVTIFMYYVLTEMPSGLKAWVTIGIVAAALSTLNSGLNSMASVIVKDLIQPLIIRSGVNPKADLIVRCGQWAMAGIAVLLTGVACICFYWQQYSDMPLLQFALSVMIFSYSGLLGVYFTAIFTQRGSSRSVCLALLVGFAAPVALQPYILAIWLPEGEVWSIGFTWQLIIGASLATIVCMLGKTPHQDEHLSTADQQVN